MFRYLIACLLLSASVAMAQTTIYFDDGSYRELSEGESIYITDESWVFSVPKGGYVAGEFVFTRLTPLTTAAEEQECLTFGGESCVVSETEALEIFSEKITTNETITGSDCSNQLTFGGLGC